MRPSYGPEKVQCALDEVNQAFQSAGIPCPPANQSTVSEETRFEKGLAVQQKIFGADTINAMRANAPAELKHIQDYLSACCFGDFYTRGTLDLKMRELITFCAICCLGGCDMDVYQFQSEWDTRRFWPGESPCGGESERGEYAGDLD